MLVRISGRRERVREVPHSCVWLFLVAMNDSKIKRWLSVLLVTASSMVMSAGDPSSCSWGEADGALRIGVMAGVDGIDKTSEISVCFENVSREGIAINL